ncbi:MAG: hypothetical protein EA406_12180 [Rhodospirillales bacterium]|nr:MAG: hypothetical protein EA406_12180 [Rhodospirillales bacterium]
MRINNNDEYRDALARADDLRGTGATVKSNQELADLMAAIEAYEARPDRPDVASGRPTPDPYGH